MAIEKQVGSMVANLEIVRMRYLGIQQGKMHMEIAMVFLRFVLFHMLDILVGFLIVAVECLLYGIYFNF